MRFREIFTEGVAETQDVLSISRAIIDYIIMNKDRFANPTYPTPDPKSTVHVPPSNVIDLKDIPGLPTPKTKAGQTLIDATRIKVVSSDVLHKNRPAGSNIGGDAAPYYTDEKGAYKGRVYPDARQSRQNAWAPNWINASGDAGMKMDIRLNADLLAPEKERQLQSTLTHELGHNLDTIKGMNTVQDQDNFQNRISDEQRLAKHKKAKIAQAAGQPFDPANLLTPDEETKLIGRVRKPIPQVPSTGSQGYYSDMSELNARLMQSAESMSNHTERLRTLASTYGTGEIDEFIKWALTIHNIPQAFVKYPSEAEFRAALSRELTQAEWKQAAANPEFQQLYKRIYKFLDEEAKGIIAQAQKDNFRTWATATANNVSQKQNFINKFVQSVIKGVEAVKDVAKVLVRKFVMTDQILTKLLLSKAPGWVAQAGFKSIPFVGIVFGIAFAIPRLFKGDVLGAGLEVASSVGSLFTSIPTTAYLIARDIYGEAYVDENGKNAVFEYDMSQDPTGTQARIKELSDRVAQILTERVRQNAPLYPQAFQTTQGGAAVGNPKIAQQGYRHDATTLAPRTR